MKEDTIIIGEILKKRRDEAQMSVQDVAEALNIDRKQVYRYENDEQNPDIDKLKKMSDLFKCDLFGDIAKKYGLQEIANDGKVAVIEQYLESIQSQLGEFHKKVTSWKSNSDDPKKVGPRSLRNPGVNRPAEIPSFGDKLTVQGHQNEQGNTHAKGKSSKGQGKR